MDVQQQLQRLDEYAELLDIQQAAGSSVNGCAVR